MFHVALRTLLTRKVRLFGIASSIVLGVALMAGSLILTTTITRSFNDMFETAFGGISAAVRAPMPIDAVQGQTAARPTIDASLIDSVGKLPNVDAASESILQYAQILDKSGKPIGNIEQGAPTIGGSWWSDSRFNPFDLVSGRAPANDSEVVIDNGSFKKGHFQIGDPVSVLTNKGKFDYTISGVIKFGSVDNPGGASFVLMTLPAAENAITNPGRVDSIGVIAKSGTSQQQIRNEVAAAIPANLEVVTGKKIVEENQNQMKTGLRFFNIFLNAFGVIALFVGAFIINNTFSILVAQRQHEHALLRALGASRRQVLLSVIFEAIAVGIIASAAGLGAGMLVALALKQLLDAFGVGLPDMSLVITPASVLTAAVAGIGISLTSAFFPARRGSRVPPLAAMRDVAIEKRGRGWVRTAGGTTLMGAGALLIGLALFTDVSQPWILLGPGTSFVFLGVAVLGPFVAKPMALAVRPFARRLHGVVGGLATENINRNPKRTARTASALVIGVALVTFISVLGASMKTSINTVIDRSFTGDFAISGPESLQGGIRPTLINEVRALPEVSAATQARVTTAQIGNSGQFVGAIDPQPFASIYNTDVIKGNLRDLTNGTLAISNKVAGDHNWHIGSQIPSRFSNGDSVNLRVVAIYDQTTFGGYLISLDTYDAHVQPVFDTMIMIKKSAGVSTEQARQAITAVAASVPTAKVQDQTQFKAEYAKQVNQMLNLVYALLGLAVLIALLGIANTLMLSILERTHELGLLRAIGMSRVQIRSMTRWESVMIAMLGTVQGIAVGIVFGWIMQRALVDYGLEEFAFSGTRIAIIAALAIIAGIVAALWPARRAARLDILRAIATT